MLKKITFAVAGAAAGLMLLGGTASADVRGGDGEPGDQTGLLNLHNTNLLDNVNLPVGVCDNNVNVLGVQVPVQDNVIPVASPGEHETTSVNPSSCSAGVIADETYQD